MPQLTTAHHCSVWRSALDTERKGKNFLHMSLLPSEPSDTGSTADLRFILSSSLGDILTLWIYSHVVFMSKNSMVLKMWCV